MRYGREDLVLVYDWGSPVVLYNRNGVFVQGHDLGFEKDKGWWTSVMAVDLNGDGRMDFAAGNHGYNSRFKATKSKPIDLLLNDLDGNGTIDPLLTMWFDETRYPFAQRADLVKTDSDFEEADFEIRKNLPTCLYKHWRLGSLNREALVIR